MSEDAFEYVWRIIKADDDEMMRRLEEGMLSDQTHPNECEECGQLGGLSNYPDDSVCDDCASDPAYPEAPSDPAYPEAPSNQRIVDMAHAAHGWGTMLANDHHESVYEDYTSDLAHPTAYGAHEGEGPHPYWEAKEKAEMLQDKIWQAGLAALGLKPSEHSYPDELPYLSEHYSSGDLR